MAAPWMIRVLVVMVVMSALGVSYSVHQARRLTDESQRLQQRQTRLETQWSQLLLEHSTWGSYARVERLAREKLGMKLPKTNERVLIRP
ncbi:MAG: cell division protein FtsL [Alcanivorax borkumensis]|jgi:cell division protein FtsL|uniref:Cell division protein FtsL n=1 Tax=Alcanivorax borkumensis (strain ATCC 700651 / DSM 11573 / NCIMB 13689 / SK2) TaxID=393595 RepID=Q0VS09_ALCBS|nr:MULTISPECIES: cell division protein FtsL [Alcanivorax]OJH07974.1 MAG: cell division protein FtsL [Alcanivorax borkumensis]EUC70122.1 cell division protein FtsL [Alcanivorax sp. 97CO-5]PKG01903.1 cell division protein FtsL [Alcanivorax sp. 97CO-6]CAL16039.1 cell division protein FtsL [Alcanivorax borkumensis SK2]BAP13459.1 cell division protein FtsL [Alcanivorax sp. NBRC 101098]